MFGILAAVHVRFVCIIKSSLISTSTILTRLAAAAETPTSPAPRVKPLTITSYARSTSAVCSFTSRFLLLDIQSMAFVLNLFL